MIKLTVSPPGVVKVNDIFTKIESGTVTREDFNTLLETSFKSARERVLRRTRTGDSNDGHDDEGHSEVNTRPSSRLAPRRGGGKLNDPRRTARGRRAVTRHEGKYREATAFILEHRGRPIKPELLQELQEPGALRLLTARMLTMQPPDGDWFYELYRQLED